MGRDIIGRLGGQIIVSTTFMKAGSDVSVACSSVAVEIPGIAFTGSGKTLVLCPRRLSIVCASAARSCGL